MWSRQPASPNHQTALVWKCWSSWWEFGSDILRENARTTRRPFQPLHFEGCGASRVRFLDDWRGGVASRARFFAGSNVEPAACISKTQYIADLKELVISVGVCLRHFVCENARATRSPLQTLHFEGGGASRGRFLDDWGGGASRARFRRKQQVRERQRDRETERQRDIF